MISDYQSSTTDQRRAPVDRGARLAAWARRVWFHRYLYLLAVPGLLFFLVFAYIPMWGVVIAFKDFHLFQGLENSPWVGLKHFTYFFGSPFFPRLLRNTLLVNGLYLLFVFPAPIILALLLNELRTSRFKRFVQTASYLPHFVSWIVVGGLLVYMFSQTVGMVNILLARLNMPPLIVLGSKTAFWPLYVASSIWKEAGWEAIIYLAAMTGISAELYEAAMIDGANRFKRVIHITLPGIAPVIVVLLILQIGSIMSVNFQQILILQGNDASLYEVSDVIDTWVYRAGFIQAQLSLATAVGLFKGIVGLALVIFANRFARRVGGFNLW